ncbi:putative phospholipase B-like 2 [Lycorma delicatula]|uniref:putative phospholipase B-like 2 n=1 Tax=Lycorma delicatula TaxID=130591 RepID=UPI003F518448
MSNLIFSINFIFYLCVTITSVCNGYYSKSIKISKDGDWLKLSENKHWLVRALYKNEINKTGFGYLEIETNPNLSNEYQAYFAGYIEGLTTSELIYSHWYNTVKNVCTDTETNCTAINTFILQNTKWVKENIQKYSSDPYWHQVKLYYTQVEGILDGCNSLIQDNQLTWMDIMWLNIYADVLDLREALGGEEIVGNGHCSVLIKILPGYKDIYFGHDTWSNYCSMLRIQKKYMLNYKKSPNSSEKIPGSQVSFPSYPGSVASVDDYYLIASGLATTETTNQIFNKSLWSTITTDNIVWESIRSVIANRLASDGESWSNIFKLYNSGTYNNQWMILDYKKFKPGNPPTTGAFWVLEQIPNKVVTSDLTQVLIDKGYWSSYNIPYYKDIYELTGYEEKFKQLGNWFSHDNAPRAKIFERDQANVTNMDSFMSLMRSNNYQHDPFAHCQCDPPYSATGAISARDDLNPSNGTYQFKGQGHRPAGAIDAKITNSSLFLNLQFIAVSGPSTGTGGALPVFKWSTSDFSNITHMSHPDVWDFKPVLHKWKLH